MSTGNAHRGADDAPRRHGVAKVNGVALYYEVSGTGRPVLLLPGLGADIRLLDGLANALCPSFEVAALDPRGAGRSDKPDTAYTIDQMADDAAGVLDHLNLGRTVVVGYSMGGRIALSLAIRRADLVERLVLAATSAYTPPTHRFGRRWFATNVLSRLPLPKGVDPQPRYAFERQLEATRAFDCRDQLDAIDVPTLVLHGRRDHMTPCALARELAGGITGARLVVVPGGHFSLLTMQRRRFANEVTAFAAA